MEEDKKSQENLDNSNEELHISDVINCNSCDWQDSDSIFKLCTICDNYNMYTNI